VIIVALEPVLDARLGTNFNPTLTIFGNLVSNYQMVFSTNIAFTNWQSAGSVLIANLQRNSDLNQTGPQIYYRTQ
jgi:hypothetical protein